MDILERARQEIRKVDRPENRIDIQRFFKEPVRKRYVLKGALFKQIASRLYQEIASLPKKEILDICDRFLASDFYYGKGFAFSWAARLAGDLRPRDFARLERWLRRHVDNWGSCDALCCGALGSLVRQYPALSARVFRWSRSGSRWLKRASAVSLIVPVRQGLLLDEVFRTADALLTDPNDMVQKGYGWMLKDASIRYPVEVFAYVMKHKAEMPRTALRYAIERYPQAKRKRAMAK